MSSDRASLATPSRRTLFSLAGVGLSAGLLAACGDSGTAGEADTPVVVTGCYPMEYLVAQVAGDAVSITQLAKPGADAHGVELSVQQTLEIQGAALVVQIPGLQTALDDAIASEDGDNVLDVSTVVTQLGSDGEDAHSHAEEEGEEEHDHEAGADDPHLWHDPVRMADIGDAIAERLGEVLPDSAGTFTENAATLRTTLEELDAELAEDFGAVDGSRTFITSHTAFGYLAERYDLRQVGITGVDPETEPSPSRLLELEQVVEDEGVSTIFFETTASPEVAQTLADNVGVEAAELDNLETQLREDADYPQVMRENAAALLESWA
ncbi:metal ABC transporter substrate-binding protein [Brachybacterium squillarum]|uniref:metal ABC transporter substrate-binding protein n=1 Tax=Brachybacterium squillarum TaxID=661979 RepID=UPI0002629B8F|nr:metal ABC transporter substrate-binding protein [Brachybacterium squillarum]